VSTPLRYLIVVVKVVNDCAEKQKLVLVLLCVRMQARAWTRIFNLLHLQTPGQRKSPRTRR
jgi:hypothetical protein